MIFPLIFLCFSFLADDSDSDDDDEVMSRDAMKRRAMSVVDAKTDKKRGRGKKKI